MGEDTHTTAGPEVGATIPFLPDHAVTVLAMPFTHANGGGNVVDDFSNRARSMAPGIQLAYCGQLDPSVAGCCFGDSDNQPDPRTPFHTVTRNRQ